MSAPAPHNRRDVALGLTPYAPGVEGKTLRDPARWLTYYAVSPNRAVAALCHRLARLPSALTAVAAPDCAAVILGRAEGVREAVPLALVASGLTPAEINAALDALRLGLTRKEAA
jgi:hypothetical protein